MLDILLSGFWVHLVIEHHLKQKICVIYYTELWLLTFINEKVIKVETLC